MTNTEGFSCKIWNKPRMCDFTRLVNSVRYGPASAVMKEKEIKKKKAYRLERKK